MSKLTPYQTYDTALIFITLNIEIGVQLEEYT